MTVRYSADYSVEMMEHSQVERKVDEMVDSKVALTAYYWADLKAKLKADYSVHLMVRY